MKDRVKKTSATLPFRLTPLRSVLLEMLSTAKAPLSALEIEKRLDKTFREAHKTTVYRNLELFERVGLVKKTLINDRTQYYESTRLGHHHHLICIECDRIEDIVLADQSVVREAEQVGRKIGFTLERHLVEFYGHCARCIHGKTTKLA